MLKYKRIILKISGQSLSGNNSSIYDMGQLKQLAEQLIKLVIKKHQIAVVVGGGNIWRGVMSYNIGMKKEYGDYMGMLATTMNCLALESVIKEKGWNKVKVYSALEMNKIAEPYLFKKVIHDLEKGYIIFLAAGTGSPCFTTDTTAILRAIELDCNCIFMAKAVDGVYDKNPKLNSDAKYLSNLTMSELLDKKLGVIDLTAAALALENHKEIIIFKNEKNNIYDAIYSDIKHTLIKGK